MLQGPEFGHLRILGLAAFLYIEKAGKSLPYSSRSQPKSRALSAYAEFAHSEGWHLVACKRIAVFVADRHDVLDDVEEVSA